MENLSGGLPHTAGFARTQDAKGETFAIKDFYERLNAIGNIPIALGHWEMTGVDDAIMD